MPPENNSNQPAEEPQLTKPPSQEPGQSLVTPPPMYQAPLSEAPAKKSISLMKILIIILLLAVLGAVVLAVIAAV